MARRQVWTLRGVVNYIRGQNKTDSKPLEGIPPISGRLSLRYGLENGPWSVEGVVRASAHRSRVDPATERERPGYTALDLYANADLGQLIDGRFKNWKAVVGIQNVFDQKIVNPVIAESLAYSTRLVGNPLLEPGRTFMVRLIQDY